MINDQDIVELSCKYAYQTLQLKQTISVNNNAYQVIKVINSDNGLNGYLFANDQLETCLIFTGSQRQTDFYNDWIKNNGANLIKRNPIQYEEGLQAYLQLSKQYPIVKVGGNSLGGGIATYVGLNSNVQVVAINPSPQVIKFKPYNSNVKTIIDKQDLLFNLCKLGGRFDDYYGEFYFFSRGNSFFDFKLNHQGQLNEFINLTKQYPFDLANNNLQMVKVDTIVLTDLVKEFLKRNYNYQVEYKLQVEQQIINIKKLYYQQHQVTNIKNQFISAINNYFYSHFKVLSNYLDFNNYFNLLAKTLDLVIFNVFDDLIVMLRKQLKINTLEIQLTNDIENNVYNLNTMFRTNKANLLVLHKFKQNLIAFDNNNYYHQTLSLTALTLKSGNLHQQVSYYKYTQLFDTAFKLFLKVYLQKYLRTIDEAIAFIFSLLQKSLVVLNNLAIISQDLEAKLTTLTTISVELQTFSTVDLFVNVLSSLQQQILAIIIPREISHLISKFKYSSGILDNFIIVSNNFNNHLTKMMSNTINNYIYMQQQLNNKLHVYNGYLKKTYI